MKRNIIIGSIIAILVLIIAPLSPVVGMQNIIEKKLEKTNELSFLNNDGPYADDPWYWKLICKIYSDKRNVELPSWKDPITMNEEDIDGPEEDPNEDGPGIDGFLWTGFDDESDWGYIEQWFKDFKEIDGDDSWGSLNLFDFFVLCYIISIIFSPIILGLIAMGWTTICFGALSLVCFVEAFDLSDMSTTIYKDGKYIKYEDGK